MKERERLQAVGNLLTQKKDERKARIRAKIKARVRIRSQKLLSKTVTLLTASVERLRTVQQELEIFNPRFNQLQSHTKSKWSTELSGVILGLTDIINKAPKG